MRIERRTLLAGTLSISLLSLSGATAAQTDVDAASELQGSEWQVSMLAARVPGDMTVSFQPDGALSVSTPCFDVEGRYATEGDTIAIEADEVPDSEGNEYPCDIVQDALSDILLEALADADRWAIEAEGTLSITPASGTLDHELTLAPAMAAEPAQAPAPGSFAGSWSLVDVIDQTGAPAPLPDDLAITLETDDAGSIGGFGGCSGYEGSYAFDESAGLSVGELVVEDEGECDQILSRWQQDYLRLLGSAAEIAIEDGRLVLGTDPWGFDLYFAPGA